MESGNDYVIQVKGNVKNLHNRLKTMTRTIDPIDEDYKKEINRGREETRICRVYEITDSLKDYESCKTMIHIRNAGIRAGKKYKEDHYYISNKTCINATYYMKGVRGHWSIENNCHWVKDAIMYEDSSRVKDMSLAENLSIIRNMVMNIYRLNNLKSIKKAMEKYCNRLNESILLINQLRIEKI